MIILMFMCGRFVRKTPVEELGLLFGASSSACGLKPSYNVAPRQPVAVIRHEGVRKLVAMSWGLVPGWAHDESIGNKLINARGETVFEKPSFRTAIRRRRCLIPADGFYEWKTESGVKTPWFISMKDGKPFCMAGLYETWKNAAGETLFSCAIITTEANEFMTGIHHRMPVIVRPGDYERWLDPEVTDEMEIKSMMTQWPSEGMTALPVSHLVNKPSNDDPGLILPA